MIGNCVTDIASEAMSRTKTRPQGAVQNSNQRSQDATHESLVLITAVHFEDRVYFATHHIESSFTDERFDHNK